MAVEQVVMAGIEAAAAVAVAKPTGPLKGTLSRITVPLEQDTLYVLTTTISMPRSPRLQRVQVPRRAVC